MEGRRTALIVASDEFEHTGLSRLMAPAADAEALAEVLGDPDIGGFDVQVVHNSPSHEVQGHVEDLFAEGRPDDLLLLHFSGHGLKSDSGELFFAAANTRPDRLASTAVSADFVQRCMRGSRARSIVLFLDCCYGGAFGEGVAVRAAGPANVLDSFPGGKLGGGRGRAVITASSAMEYAFEGSALATADQRQPSVFTSALVEGLSTGAADRDEDGLVSLNELYEYVFDQVRAQNPNQTPSRDIELQGELYVARSRRRRIRPIPLPADLHAAVQDGNMYTRLGAVGELRARLASPDAGVALGAREALEAVARSDTSYVAEAARDALAAAPAAAETASPEPPAASPPTGTAAWGAEPAVAPSAWAPMAAPPTASEPAPTPEATLEGTREAAPVSTPASAGPTSLPSTGPGTPAPVTSTPHAADPTPAPAAAATPLRVPTGWVALTGGGLMALSALVPTFVYGSDAFSFRPWLAVLLLTTGTVTLAVAAGTLWWGSLRARWSVALATGAALGLLTLVLVLATTSGLNAYDLQIGFWTALAGGLVSVAAGGVAVAGLRGTRAAPGAPSTTAARIATPEPLPAPAPGPAAPTDPRLPSWLGGAILAMGVLVLASLALHVEDDTSGWDYLPLSAPRLMVLGTLAVTAGACALWLRGRGQVGPGLAAGLVGPAGLGVLGWFTDMDLASVQEGWYLGLVGQVGAAVLGVLAAVATQRSAAPGPVRARSSATRAVAWGSSAAAATLLCLSGAWVSDSSTPLAAGAFILAALALGVPASLEGLPALRAWALLGWSVAASGAIVTLAAYVRDRSEPTWPLAIALACLAGLAVAAVTERPWRVGAGGQSAADQPG